MQNWQPFRFESGCYIDSLLKKLNDSADCVGFVMATLGFLAQQSSSATKNNACLPKVYKMYSLEPLDRRSSQTIISQSLQQGLASKVRSSIELGLVVLLLITTAKERVNEIKNVSARLQHHSLQQWRWIFKSWNISAVDIVDPQLPMFGQLCHLRKQQHATLMKVDVCPMFGIWR